MGFPDSNGDFHILGLCEGNHCSHAGKDDIGNRQVVIMTRKQHDDGNHAAVDDDAGCIWETVRVVCIPQSATFLDYSSIDITQISHVVISSQEDSSVWLGRATGISDRIISPNEFEFEDDEKSRVLRFPRDSECHTVYCNIEGVHFINDEMSMAVSDKMKGNGRQDFRCQEKDQSIHPFVIP